ncbi:MFS transporter [Thalassobaculum fulvum]|uniref:MFS transporter n=1 Tax=Thalassobaculum fulvum TaxID=1633335 RepID=A0A918XPJ2_9PROT|nr:MFS transporter [Thalassobaculum fulvum]GHD43990.1 MFS transporter [Thalassobaculum fulvum]
MSQTATESPDGLDTPRRYWAWATILLGVTLAVLDSSMANIALPTIATYFDASPAVSIWIVNGYQLAIVMSLLPLASLGEIVGYRRVYLAGVSLFTVAAVGCAFAGSLGELTAIRIVQGLGAAGLMGVNAALLRYTVPKARFGTAIGVNAMVVASSATVGPTIGGLILSVVDWPWLFAIHLPLGAIVVAMGWFTLPDSDRASRRFDVVSAGLSAASIGLVVTTLDSIGHGLAWPLVVAQAVACVIASTLLVRRELRVPEPLLPLDLLAKPVFSLSIATSTASFVAQVLAFVSLPFTFQRIHDFPPLEVGLLMMPWPLAIAVVAPFAGRLSDRWSPAIIVSAGMTLMATGLAALALLPDDPGRFDIAWRMVLCGAGFGLFQAPNNRTLITAAPRARSGAASGMLGTARLTGQAVGAALVALLLGRLGIQGATWALVLGAGFAATSAVVSILRLKHLERADGAAPAAPSPSRD